MVYIVCVRDAQNCASHFYTMAFYYIYVLRSLQHNFIYVGFTLNLTKRFQEHNKFQVISTKHFAPFELIHYEAYKNEIDAKRREEYLKTTRGKTTLRTMLKEYFQIHSQSLHSNATHLQ